MTDQEVSLSAVERTLSRMEVQLDNILAEAKRTNGRVSNLEEKAEQHSLFRMQVLTVAGAVAAVGTVLTVVAKLLEFAAKLVAK